MGHLGADERPQDRIPPNDPYPVADLVEDRHPVGGRGRLGLLPPDRAEEDRRDEERDGVDRDRDRAPTGAGPGSRRYRRRRIRRPSPMRRQRAVGLDQLFALDDRRQVGVVGGVEERRQDRCGCRDDHESGNVSTPATNATGTEPSRTARPRSAQIRTGRRRRRSTHARRRGRRSASRQGPASAGPRSRMRRRRAPRSPRTAGRSR